MGDHHPLQGALTAWPEHNSHRAEIVLLLLDHGADPNGRWCPFESRARPLPNLPTLYARCFSDVGITPLMFAASIRDVESVKALVKAGADSALRDGDGRTAQDRLSAYAPDDLGRFGAYKENNQHREEIIEILSRSAQPTPR